MKKIFTILFIFSLFFSFARVKPVVANPAPKCFPECETKVLPIHILIPYDCFQRDSSGIPHQCVRPDKQYCPPDGQNFYLYTPGTNSCDTLGTTDTYNCFKAGQCNSAIGTVPTNSLTDFLTFALKWAFYASGGVILLMIISTGYTIITSSGNPEKLQAAKENIIALFSGLALLAFSLVLMQTIGADILGIPGFR